MIVKLLPTTNLAMRMCKGRQTTIERERAVAMIEFDE